MAKVYKVSLYITDYNEEYQDGEHLKSGLQEQLDDLWVGVDHLEIQESNEFEWDDELAINKVDTAKEEFEVYFKGSNESLMEWKEASTKVDESMNNLKKVMESQ